MTTDIIARLLCAALTFYVPLSAFTAPRSLPARVSLVDAVTSYPLFLGMTVIAVAILCDVAANKMCPHKRCRILWLASLREIMFIGAAFCALVVPFVASKFFLSDDATSYLYLVIFSGSVALTWCDSLEQRGQKSATPI